MSTKKIIVTIDQLGTPTIEADGFNGVGCEAATSLLEAKLSGGEVATRDYKTEFNNASDEVQQTEKAQW